MAADAVNASILGAKPWFVRHATEGVVWRWIGGAVTFLAQGHEVGDRYMLETSPLPSGAGPKPHVHSREDEMFYVLDGGPIAFTAGNRTVRLGAGGFINLSAGTAHHFENGGSDAHLLCFNAPAGFDRFQRDVAGPWNGPGAPEPSPEEEGKRTVERAPDYGISMRPEPALFEREPVVRVVEVGTERAEADEGVVLTLLAGPGHTGGRYAMAHAALAPGARLPSLGHAVAATGLQVLAGTLRLTVEGRPSDLAPGSFVHLGPGVAGTCVNDGATRAALLVWHAPGLAVPCGAEDRP